MYSVTCTAKCETGRDQSSVTALLLYGTWVRAAAVNVTGCYPNANI
jgi:hypothetical protein